MIHPVSFADDNLMRTHPVNTTFPWLSQRSRMNMCIQSFNMALPCLPRGQELRCCFDKKYTMVSAYRPTKQVNVKKQVFNKLVLYYRQNSFLTL